MRSRGRRRDLHEHEEEPPGGVADELFGVAEALDDKGDESVLKWNLKWSSESTATESRAWSAPWETLKLLSEERCVGRRKENLIK